MGKLKPIFTFSRNVLYVTDWGGLQNAIAMPAPYRFAEAWKPDDVLNRQGQDRGCKTLSTCRDR
jgi:hypothetical protein